MAPRETHIMFAVVLLIFIFTFLNHVSTSSDDHQTYRGYEDGQTKASIADRLKPYFGGSGSLGKLQDHLKRSEAIYQEMIKERPKLMATYENPASPDKKLFPSDSGNAYWKTPFTIWDFLPAAFNCPHSTRRLGRMGDGGKWLCGLEKFKSLPKSRKSSATPKDSEGKSSLPKGHQPGCIIYSFGIQAESTFEEELLERTPNCQIWGYDFSVDKFGPQLKEVEAQGRAFFTKAGIAGETDTTRSPPFYSIQDLMIMNGHDHIDIMKMDIEGYEFESMLSVIKYFGDRGEEIPISEFLVEIHLDPGRIGVDEMMKWWETLEAAGFRPAWTEPNLLVSTIPLHDAKPRYSEYSFINIKDRRSPLLQ